jgi:NAD(P)-dependent dehydrogenase (short-subunit alcohol dehydrogenase family)
MELADVRGIITGGAAGLGKKFAETILAAGGKVVITDVDAAQLKVTGEALQAQFGVKNAGFFVQDVTDGESFHAAFAFAAEHFEAPVNVLVNNAGISGDMNFFKEDTPRAWEKVIAIDLIGLMRGTQVGAATMRKTLDGAEGVIVNLCSMAAFCDCPFWPQYAAAKSGVLGFTKSMHQLKKSGNVRVMALCPGFADTAMGQDAVANFPQLMGGEAGLLTPEAVAAGLVKALADGDNAGRSLVVADQMSFYHVGNFTPTEFSFPDFAV